MIDKILPYVVIVGLIAYIVYTNYFCDKKKKFSMVKAFDVLSKLQDEIIASMNPILS